MKAIVVMLGLLIAYTLIWTGLSRFGLNTYAAG